jgi:hypothetical protein
MRTRSGPSFHRCAVSAENAAKSANRTEVMPAGPRTSWHGFLQRRLPGSPISSDRRRERGCRARVVTVSATRAGRAPIRWAHRTSAAATISAPARRRESRDSVNINQTLSERKRTMRDAVKNEPLAEHFAGASSTSTVGMPRTPYRSGGRAVAVDVDHDRHVPDRHHRALDVGIRPDVVLHRDARRAPVGHEVHEHRLAGLLRLERARHPDRSATRSTTPAASYWPRGSSSP